MGYEVRIEYFIHLQLMTVLCFSDGLLSGLEACEPFPFATSKLGPVSVDVWLSIIKLTGLTGEVCFLIVIIIIFLIKDFKKKFMTANKATSAH